MHKGSAILSQSLGGKPGTLPLSGSKQVVAARATGLGVPIPVLSANRGVEWVRESVSHARNRAWVIA